MTDSPSKKVKTDDVSTLGQLRKYSKIVVDTGDLSQISIHSPEDATTNPSLILNAANSEGANEHINNAIEFAIEDYLEAKSKALVPKKKGRKPLKEPVLEISSLTKKDFSWANISEAEKQEILSVVIDKVAVNFGAAISKLVPGYVSTEVDARLSFDEKSTIARAKRILKYYKDLGIPKDRILIKIASTWEGIQATKKLQKEKINCNNTLIFSLVQAVASAEANAFLISPFVGRIYDWYKKAYPNESYRGDTDPGVLSVKEIFRYFKSHSYKTIVMGASFRNIEQITSLSGCDRLTISPKLLEDLGKLQCPVYQKLNSEDCKDLTIPDIPVDEKNFRYLFNGIPLIIPENGMATEKLSEGIRKFSDDTKKLEAILIEKLSSYVAPVEEEKEKEAVEIENVATVKEIVEEVPVENKEAPIEPSSTDPISHSNNATS